MRTRDREEIDCEDIDDAEATEEQWLAAELAWAGYRLAEDTDDARESFAAF